MTDREPIAPGANDLMLVLGTVAMVLELAAVMANLMLFADGTGDPGRKWPGIGHGRAVASAGPPRIVGPMLTQSLAMPVNLAGEPAPALLPQGCTSGPWASPLYPQNGVTLWDRIRDSSKNDRRAFLVGGTAIQLHAPATAAILHVRSGLPERYAHTSTAATRPYWRRTARDSRHSGCSR